MIATTCAHCQRTFPASRTRTRTCSPLCRRAHDKQRQQQAGQDWTDDFLWIAGTDTWTSIAARLGCSSVANLERKLYRLGLHQWARIVAMHDTSGRKVA